jgi:hypothetical protein
VVTVGPGAAAHAARSAIAVTPDKARRIRIGKRFSSAVVTARRRTRRIEARGPRDGAP